jgi:Putative collagen-binding domain of a collagenase
MGTYRARWFDPRTGGWSDVAGGKVRSNNIGEIDLPDFPSDADWALSLTYEGPAPLSKHF